MSGTGESKTVGRIRNWVAGGITALVIGAAAVGAPVLVNASNAAHASQVTATQQARDASVIVKAAGTQQDVLAQSATDAGQIAAQEAAQKAAEAQAAAALAAQQQAAAQAAAQQQAAQDAAARQQSAQQTQSDASTPASGSGGSSSSGEPSGTPLPMAQVTDPNNGQYGQMVPTVDPASWCANHSASTINGVPTCD